MFPVGQFNFPSRDEYQRTVGEILDSGWFTNHGPKARLLEERLSQVLEVRNCVLVSNATLGLSMLVEAFESARRLVTSAVSFPATGWAFQFRDLPVELVDVDIQTGHIDVERLRVCVRPDDLVVVPNLYAGASQIGELESLAMDVGFSLIFDSAGALGTRYREKALGGFGFAEVFSLHATKIVSGGEGGCISTNDDALADVLRSIRSSYGNPSPVSVRRTANGRISEMSAALALLGLERLDEFVERNHEKLDRYHTQLDFSVIPFRPLKINRYVSSNASVAAFKFFDESHYEVEALVRVLRDTGVECRRYYRPGLHKLPWPADMHVGGLCNPDADSFLESIIQLPLGERVGLGDIDNVCSTINEFYA